MWKHAHLKRWMTKMKDEVSSFTHEEEHHKYCLKSALLICSNAKINQLYWFVQCFIRYFPYPRCDRWRGIYVPKSSVTNECQPDSRWPPQLIGFGGYTQKTITQIFSCTNCMICIYLRITSMIGYESLLNLQWTMVWKFEQAHLNCPFPLRFNALLPYLHV